MIDNKTEQTVEIVGYITKASLDDKGRMIFNATASDTSLDSYQEKMTLNLYKSFIDYINKGVNLPIYASLSHYPRLSGKGEIGVVTDVYVDGDRLKAKGYFKDTPLGVSVYNAIRKDRRDNIPADDRVRISIGFYDRKHEHENGSTWEFKSAVPCLDCIKGVGGKTYLEGILEHLAVTRVPVNKRTDIVAKSEGKDMTTRYEDAVSIVGDPELVDEVEKALQDELQNKSGATDELIIKSEDSKKVWDDLSGLQNNHLLELFKKMTEDGTITEDALSRLVNGILNQITPSSEATDIKRAENTEIPMSEVNPVVAKTNNLDENNDVGAKDAVAEQKLETSVPVSDVKPLEDRLAKIEELLAKLTMPPAKVEETDKVETPIEKPVETVTVPALTAPATETNVLPAWKSITSDFEAGLSTAVAKNGSERLAAFNELMNNIGQSLYSIHTELVNTETPNTIVPTEKSDVAEIVNRAVDEKLAPVNAQLAQIANMLNNMSVARGPQPAQNGNQRNVEVPTMKSIVMPTSVPNNAGKGMKITDIANATTFGSSR